MATAHPRRSGAQVLIDQLRIHGVDTIFGVPGESYLADFFDGLRRTVPEQAILASGYTDYALRWPGHELDPTYAFNPLPGQFSHVVDGKLQLGRWQRVFLVELDGPRARDVSLLLLGDGR